MKYTEAQKIRAVKKLARTFGRYNYLMKTCDEKTRLSRSVAMTSAVVKVVIKFGMYPEYQKAIEAIHRSDKPVGGGE